MVEPVFCIIEVGTNKNTPVPGCEPFAQVDESFGAFQVSDFLSREPTMELVPDGVASVRITYRDTAPIVAKLNKAFGGNCPIRIEWLDSARRLVRAIGPPTAESNSTTSVGNLRAPIEG